MTENESAEDRPGKHNRTGTVLLTGATGFVIGHLLPRLEAAGFDVRCATRDPARAAAPHPERTWVRVDVTNAPLTDESHRQEAGKKGRREGNDDPGAS